MAKKADEADEGARKTKAVARCENCGEYIPVRIWGDESIHPVGTGDACCEDALYRVVETDTPAEFADTE